jgi:cyanophycin synthetase
VLAAARLLVRVRTFREYGPLFALRHKPVAARFYAGSESFKDLEYAAIWRDAARELGAHVVDHGHGFLEIAAGRRSTWVWRQYVMLDDVLAFRRSLDKELVHDLLGGAGLPIPAHAAFRASDLRPAVAFLRSRGGPCIVKPADGTGGGMGVTSGVRSPNDLVLATALATRFGGRLLIEEQVAGSMYRLLFLEGRLVGVVRRRSTSVVGDGQSTVRELIARENRRRLAARGSGGFSLLRVDLDCLATLRAGGWSMRAVPRPGEDVTLKISSSDNRREDNETIRAPLDPGLVAQAAAATELLGLRLAGVDVISADPGRPLADTGGVIIEVNCTPGLSYHYHIRDEPTRVAVQVLRRLLEPAPP